MTTLTLDSHLEAALCRPLTHTSRSWYAWLSLLLLSVVGGFIAYASQVQQGLVVTGMRDTVTWGVYISNFVFFSGLSMAGTFISAILRITRAEWRRPLTRIAELTTVSALLMCSLMPMVDIGRPDRIANLLVHGRLQSPLVWDILAITTYLTASAIYLYIFLIPDAAILRDHLGSRVSRVRRRLYAIAAMGWHGAPEQRRRLERAATIMMLLVIPIGVTVHSVVSWIFGMTFRAGWNSTIFAPYFAVGALYSGTAMLITLMWVFRRLWHLEPYFAEKHFRYLGYMMGAFGLIYLYFTFAEYLTVAYKLEGGERLLLEELFTGRYSVLVWVGFLGGQILPVTLSLIPIVQVRRIQLLVVASVLANIGMWIKRFVIVVPSLSLPQMPYEWGVYTPSAVELLITVASFAGFALVFTLFAKLFPIVSLWEMQEAEASMEEEHAGARQAVEGTVPQGSIRGDLRPETAGAD